MIIWMLLACGLGALLRYGLSHWNSKAALPWGTLTANVLGAFLIGLFYQRVYDQQLYLVLATGFCAGLTTFSTLNAELAGLFKERRKFLTYLALTYLLGLVAIILGIFL